MLLSPTVIDKLNFKFVYIKKTKWNATLITIFVLNKNLL